MVTISLNETSKYYFPFNKQWGGNNFLSCGYFRCQCTPMLESTTNALVVENSITIDDSRATTNLGTIDDLGRIINS